jgi:hypothetical protein
MTKRPNRSNAPVKDLAGPVYLVLDKGGPGLRLRLRGGRWLVDALSARAVSGIVRARECGARNLRCSGECPSGRTCRTVVSLEVVDYMKVPEGIPPPPSGRGGFVVKQARRLCRCLAPAR